jgi:hypothetical protein
MRNEKIATFSQSLIKRRYISFLFSGPETRIPIIVTSSVTVAATGYRTCDAGL